jgi:transposase-like protein
MAEPKDMQEYTERFAANQKITGFGVNVTMHMPCPFCAEPDFMVYKIIETEDATGGTCKACNRTLLIEHEVVGPTRTIRMYQTGGPPQPEWLNPKMPQRGD